MQTTNTLSPVCSTSTPPFAPKYITIDGLVVIYLVPSACPAQIAALITMIHLWYMALLYRPEGISLWEPGYIALHCTCHIAARNMSTHLLIMLPHLDLFSSLLPSVPPLPSNLLPSHSPIELPRRWKVKGQTSAGTNFLPHESIGMMGFARDWREAIAAGGGHLKPIKYTCFPERSLTPA